MKLNVGLIGLGRLGRVYARDLAARVTACASRLWRTQMPSSRKKPRANWTCLAGTLIPSR